MTNQELGAHGENLATKHLEKLGYFILERNYRFGRNEVDIIAKKENYVRFIEVKTRVTAEIGEPWKAVTKTKQKQIIKVANHFLVENEMDNEAKFDIVSIVTNQFRTDIELIDDAFTA